MSVTRYLVDTNILLRFLSGEPARQAAAAKKIFPNVSAFTGPRGWAASRINMGTFALITILAGLASVATSIACRGRTNSGRQPSYLLAIIGALCSEFVFLMAIYNRALFTRGFWHELWNDDRLPGVIFVPLFLGFCTFVSLIPAVLIVWYHRQRFRNDDKGAKP